MTETKVSNKRYNKHKVETNELNASIRQYLRGTKIINSKYLTMPNIVETYQDKIYEIYDNLYRENIDFWGNDFALREAIITDLKAHMKVGIYFITKIAEIVYSHQDIVLENRYLNNKNMKTLSPIVAKIRELNDYIQEYTIEEKIDISILSYFNNIELSGFITPIKIKRAYQLMKKCSEDMGLQNKFEEVEPKVLEIIDKKEEKWKASARIESEKLFDLYSSLMEKTDKRTSHTR